MPARLRATTDLDGAWYVIAATDDRGGQRAGQRRPPRRAASSASAPTTRPRRPPGPRRSGGTAGVTVAVLGRPRAATGVRRAVRDAIVDRRSARAPSRAERAPAVGPGVVLVGGGPGDPELISVAGRRALMEADVVVADRLAPRELLGELPADVEVIDVAKLPRGRSAQQEEINRVIVDRALAGKRVVRFKGGDSFVFGRGYEEVARLPRGRRPGARSSPGCPARSRCPALAGIPVTHRGVAHEFTVVSGHLPPGHPESLVDWDARRPAARHAAC